MQDRCFYCGEPATDLDHVIPQCMLRVKRRTKGRYQGDLVVPACRECNGLLGAALLPTLEDRFYYARVKLADRYRKVIAMPDWEQDELDDLGPGMKADVIRAVNAKKKIEARLGWPILIDPDLDMKLSEFCVGIG